MLVATLGPEHALKPTRPNPYAMKGTHQTTSITDDFENNANKHNVGPMLVPTTREAIARLIITSLFF